MPALDRIVRLSEYLRDLTEREVLPVVQLEYPAEILRQTDELLPEEVRRILPDQEFICEWLLIRNPIRP